MNYLEPRGGPNSLPVAHPAGLRASPFSNVALRQAGAPSSLCIRVFSESNTRAASHLSRLQIVIGAAIGMTSNPLHGPSQWRHPDTPSPSLAQSLLDSALSSFFTNTSIKLEISTPSAGVRFPRGPPLNLPRAPPPRRPGVQSRACPQKHTDHAAPARSYRG